MKSHSNVSVHDGSGGHSGRGEPLQLFGLFIALPDVVRWSSSYRTVTTSGEIALGKRLF